MNLLTTAQTSLINGGLTGIETALLSMLGGGIAGLTASEMLPHDHYSMGANIATAVGTLFSGYVGSALGLVLGSCLAVTGVGTSVIGVTAASTTAGLFVYLSQKQ